MLTTRLYLLMADMKCIWFLMVYCALWTATVETLCEHHCRRESGNRCFKFKDTVKHLQNSKKFGRSLSTKEDKRLIQLNTNLKKKGFDKICLCEQPNVRGLSCTEECEPGFHDWLCLSECTPSTCPQNTSCPLGQTRVLGQCQPINRSKVFSAASKLKGSPIVIREDLPEEIAERRRRLYPYFREAKERGMTAKLQNDKLIINGLVYDTTSIESSLVHLRPICEQRDDKVLAFFGENPRFSNFHKSQFYLEDDYYYSVEHCYQSLKARTFRPDLVPEIKNAPHPAICKRKGDSIRIDRNAHGEQLTQWMYDAMYAKFNQNPHLQQTLLETGNLQLVESSSDMFWGTGLRLNHPRALQLPFPGQNKMGQILMKVRSELREESAPIDEEFG